MGFASRYSPEIPRWQFDEAESEMAPLFFKKMTNEIMERALNCVASFFNTSPKRKRVVLEPT